MLAALGEAFAVSGNRSGARQLLARLMELSKRQYVSPYDIALLHVSLNQKDNAFAWLEKA
jgi:hypothetical protein